MRSRKKRTPHGAFGTIASNFRDQRCFVLLTCLFIIGFLTGVLTVRTYNGAFPKYISNLFNNYFESRSRQSFFTTCLNSFSSDILLFLGAFASGLCIIGVPAVLFVLVFKGLGLGLVTGYLFSCFGFQGMAYSALLIIPVNLISCIALIFVSVGAFRFSSKLFALVRKNGTRMSDFQSEFKLYCLSFGVLIIILLLSAILDAALSKAFIGFFEGKLH